MPFSSCSFELNLGSGDKVILLVIVLVSLLGNQGTIAPVDGAPQHESDSLLLNVVIAKWQRNNGAETRSINRTSIALLESCAATAASSIVPGAGVIDVSLQGLTLHYPSTSTKETRLGGMRTALSQCFMEINLVGVEIRDVLWDLAHGHPTFSTSGSRRQSAVVPTLNGSITGFNYSGAYDTLAALEARMERLVSLYPTTAQRYVIGYSQQERHEIYAIRLSRSPLVNDASKPEFVLVGTHHAREWISAEIVMAMAELVCFLDRRSSRVTRIVNETELWFIPVLNPDGYEYSFGTGRSEVGWAKRMWRKNRRDMSTPSATADIGVDLNRNYAYEWGRDNFGSSPFAVEDTYRGPSPNSEREVVDLIAFLRNLRQSSRWVPGVP